MVQNLWLCTSKQNLIRLILMRRWVVEPDCDWGWGADFSILDISLLFLLVLKVCLILRPLSHIHIHIQCMMRVSKRTKEVAKKLFGSSSLYSILWQQWLSRSYSPSWAGPSSQNFSTALAWGPRSHRLSRSSLLPRSGLTLNKGSLRPLTTRAICRQDWWGLTEPLWRM